MNHVASLSDILTFFVDGVPVPQGSMRTFVVKGRAILTHRKGQDLAVWRQGIAERARAAGAVSTRGPLHMTLEFHLLKPPSRRKRDQWPDRRPDLDKLVRAALDALTGVVFADDAQVVSLAVGKRFSDAPGLGVMVMPPIPWWNAASAPSLLHALAAIAQSSPPASQT